MLDFLVCSLLESSAAVSIFILLLLLFRKRLSHYSPKSRMAFWWVLAARLLIPCPVGIVYFGDPREGIAFAAPLALIWAIGTVVLFSGHLLCYMRFERQMQRGLEQCALSEEERLRMERIFAQVKEELGKVDRVQLWVSANASGPMLLGFLHPKVVMPDCVLEEKELAMIFRHELLHHRRHDGWYRLFMLLTQSVHWFNPLVWLMARRAAEDLESACDRSVIQGKDRAFVEDYAQSLLETAKCLLQRKRVHQTVLVSYMSTGAQRLKERLIALFEPTCLAGGPLFLLLVLLAMLGIYIV